MFGIGDKVIKIDNNVRGTVIKVLPARRGRQLYTVVFPTGETQVLEDDLKHDFDESDPFERCREGIFGSYSEYAKKNTTFKIKNSNNSTISSLKASKTLFRPYQFKPLLKFLNSPNRRLLVADEVGLGKTIEAGHIMLELKARNELKNVLIVCPKSLEEKWKAELYEKFGLAFKIIETAKDLIADLSSNTHNVRAIVNYEKIRESRSKAEVASKKGKKYTNLCDYLSDNPQKFSLVLCDEAHKMRNKSTQTYKGAEVIMNCAEAVLFLTATPIMISEENLYNLLHLLDSTRYFNYDIFKNRLNENRPFVEAISRLNRNVPFCEIYKELVNSSVKCAFYNSDGEEIFNESKTIAELYEEDAVFSEVMQLLEEEDTPKTRARLQYLLSTMSMMNTVFSRTRKREVTRDLSQAERSPHICKIQLHPNEQETFDQVINDYTDDNSYTDFWGEEKLTLGGALGLVQRKRQVASSVWGYLNDETSLDQGVDLYADEKDAKIEELIKIINTVFSNGTKKIVIFALYRKTLKYLNIRLKKAGFNSLIIHGEVENRAELLAEFKNNSEVQILLSSEVGSEGLDMQFCNSMVNYDLPWNPMVVEQRIGRIDRFGQKSPVINIYNLVVAGSIQEEIYMRLLERIGIFRGTIGDMEAILDAELKCEGKTMTIQDVYKRMEKEFFTKNLTKEEKEFKISEVERAIENENENLKHLKEGLSNTLTNDSYFQDEINRIWNNNAYVTEQELRNFVQSVIRQHLTTCSMEEVADGVMEFKLPLSQPTVLKNFLDQYTDNREEAEINASYFKRQIENQTSFRLTFSQEKAYENSSLIYVNLYHPIIHACLNYFIEQDDRVSTSFSYSLTADNLLKKENKYIFGLYQLNSKRKVQGVEKHSSQLVPVLFDLRTNELETNQEIVDRIFKRSQVEGNERNICNSDIDADSIGNLQYDFASFISYEKKQRMLETNRQIESDRKRNIQQTIEYFRSRAANFETTIREEQSMLEILSEEESEHLKRTRRIRLAKNQLAILEKDKNERLQKIEEDTDLQMDDTLLSLNLVTIV